VRCAVCLAQRGEAALRKQRLEEKAKELLGSSEESSDEEAFVKSLSKLPRKQAPIEVVEEKPAVVVPTVNYYKAGRKNYTTSIVIPSSIVDNAQSLELKTYLVS